MADKVENKNELLDTSAILAGIQALGLELKSISARQDSIERRNTRSDASARVASFAFSRRADGEAMATYISRHDAEEKELAKDEEEAGKEKSEAEKSAKDKRKDAEAEEEAEMKAAADKGKKDADDPDKDKKADGEMPDFMKKKDAKKDGNVTTSSQPGSDAKKDADKDEKDKKADSRADSVSIDAFNALKAKLEAFETASRPLTDADINAFGKVQSRADSVYSALGSRARAPLQGESLLAYRRHFINDLKQYSTTWKDKDLSVVAANDAVFATVEEQIMNEAEATARSPATTKPGELRMRTIRMDSGHIRNEFIGRPSAWMDSFAGPVKQAATKFLTDNRSNRGDR